MCPAQFSGYLLGKGRKERPEDQEIRWIYVCRVKEWEHACRKARESRREKIDGNGEAHEDQCKFFESQPPTVTSGVPLGSVPGPLPFIIYFILLSNILTKYGMNLTMETLSSTAPIIHPTTSHSPFLSNA